MIYENETASDMMPDGRLTGSSDAILRNIADGVIGTDSNGDIIYINEAAEELTGWNKETAVNRKISEVFRLVHARNGKDLPDIFGEVMQSGKRTGLVDQTMLVSRDGEKRYLSANVAPVRDDSSAIIGAVGVFRDVTRFKTIEDELRKEKDNFRKSEQALKESEAKFKALFNNVTDAIFVMVIKGICPNCTKNRIIEVNDTASKLLGYSRSELLTMEPKDLIDGSNTNRDSFENIILTNREAAIDMSLLCKDGSAIDAEVCAHRMILYEEQVVMAIVRDVTEQKKAQKEVQNAIEATKAAYKAKSQFLANMSHEIRTPLNGIIGMIDLCLLTTLTAEQKDNIITAKSCAASLLSIINNILDFSKLEAGKMNLEHIPFDLKELAAKLGKIHFYRSADKGLSFKSTIDGKIPDILYGDPNRLEQVINNLLSNAVKFTETGEICLALSLVGESAVSARVHFEIKDSGIGIAEEDMEKLFKSFTQVDGSHTRKYGGTGLGLVISKQLIDSMGGTLDVRSKKGDGSTFFFELDFDIAKPVDYPSANERLENIKKARSKAHILLVEDDRVNQAVVSQMLKMLGYSCEIAENGLIALKCISKVIFDLCLMDIQMPEMDGISAVKEIRRIEKKTGNHLPVVALTAYALPGDRERFIMAGMDDYLSKPLGISDLGSKLQQVLDLFKGGLRYNPENRDDQEIRSEKISQFTKSGESSMKNLGIAIEHEDIASVEKYAHDIQIQSSETGEEFLKMAALRIVLIARKGHLEELPEAYRKLTDKWKAYLFKQT